MGANRLVAGETSRCKEIINWLGYLCKTQGGQERKKPPNDEKSEGESLRKKVIATPQIRRR